MKRLIKYTLVLFVTALVPGVFLGCDLLFGEAPGKPLAFLDIADARHLVIGSGSITATGFGPSSRDRENRLFKITDQGFLVEVKYTDSDGNTVVKSSSPIRVEVLDGEWVLVVFGYDEINPYQAYLVRNTDGAAFEIPRDYLPYPDSYGDYFTVVGDVAYYLTSKNISGNLWYSVAKVHLSENPTAERVTPSTDALFWYGTNFAAGPAGNLVYKAAFQGNVNSIVRRVRYQSGALSSLGKESDYFWTGLDGEIYLTVKEDADDLPSEYAHYPVYRIMRINFSGASHTFDYYGTERLFMSGRLSSESIRVKTDGTERLFMSSGLSRQSIRVKTDSRIVIFMPRYIFQKFDSVSGEPRVIVGEDALDLTSIDSYAVDKGTLFIAGRNASGPVLFAVDVESDEYTHSNVLPPGFEVFKISPYGPDELVINALRLQDGRRIVGRLNTTTQAIETIDEEADMVVKNLVRIR